MAKVTLDVNLPEDASLQDLRNFCLFMFHGHGASDELLELFDHELDVEDFDIEN